jgi:hypothetical protein
MVGPTSLKSNSEGESAQRLETREIREGFCFTAFRDTASAIIERMQAAEETEMRDTDRSI